MRSVAFQVLCLVLCGCAANNPVQPPRSDSKFVPPAGIAVSLCEFKRVNRRWPGDYQELSDFFRDHYRNWQMDDYDRVVFTPAPDGSLAVLAVAGTQTNQMTLR